MDRRQRKTRNAIFDAFISLLKEKSFDKITVAEIIGRADIGRATFYSHFETKDFLLKELCGELFCHIFDAVKGETGHNHIFECNAPDSVYLHLFEHLYKNDNRILDLLACPNNALFLQYFRDGLITLIESQTKDSPLCKTKNIPHSFVVNHIASSFVETVNWWTRNKLKETPEEINRYFLEITG